jgi:hypothetical protein
MKEITTELSSLLTSCTERFSSFTEADWAAKPNPSKWSKKEILGHLIDSALNNHRRFIVTQYAENEKIVYYQDQWVFFQGYQQADTHELINLWCLINRQILRVLEIMPQSVWTNLCDTGKNGEDLHTLEWLAMDYVAHLKHHLESVFSE